jgi:hypothetical protein
VPPQLHAKPDFSAELSANSLRIRYDAIFSRKFSGLTVEALVPANQDKELSYG